MSQRGSCELMGDFGLGQHHGITVNFSNIWRKYSTDIYWFLSTKNIKCQSNILILKPHNGTNWGKQIFQNSIYIKITHFWNLKAKT